MKWKKKVRQNGNTEFLVCFFFPQKITLETEFSTVSVCWGLLDEHEEATWIFSQTLVLWYGLRRRKWPFWTILDCSQRILQDGGKNGEKIRLSAPSLCWPICASLVDRNVLRIKSGSVTASEWWLELWSTGGSREPIMGWTVQLTEMLQQITYPAYTCLFPNWSIPSFTWLEAVTWAVLLAALSAKDSVYMMDMCCSPEA